MKLNLNAILIGLLLAGTPVAFLQPESAQAAVKKKHVEKAKPAAKEEEAAAPEVETMSSEDAMPVKLVVDPATAAANTDPLAAGVPQVAPTDATGAEVPAAAMASATQTESQTATNTTTSTKSSSALDVNKAAENEIPVLAHAKETKHVSTFEYGRLVITLGVLAIFLGGASFALRRWANKKGGKNNNTRIKILTQHHLGPKKSLAIIQVAGESLLVGVTDHNISMLKTLALIDDEVPENVPQNFDTTLDDYEDMDEFQDLRGKGSFALGSISDIRDVVTSRLKNKNF
jgi:flagellar protein FliO/FliZ